MRAGAVLLILALLSGCAKVAAPFLPAYRDTSVPIASKADFDLGRFAGRWHEVAKFPVPFQTGCAGAVADYSPAGPGQVAVRNTCLDPDGRALRAITGRARVTGPGRLDVALSGVPGAAPLWVLWTDADYRVAVLGQPDGRAGWIVSRDPTLRPDLMEAAREVLAFNGYDIARLVRSGKK
ncbi:lipocalin family protein [Jannaschia sp. LMIT008]|uniref:lipocalin family protein n=1 Tax=Jannaschia maritima TaxID=3032585 RepID=UPI00281246A7|nr:lipocalin family protein [Jannaschia sp. LMIT008]